MEPKRIEVWRILLYAIGINGVMLLLNSILPRSPMRMPPWKAASVCERVSLLQPGMNEAQVWKTLGLSEYGFKTHCSGSGSMRCWPILYPLWPGYSVFMRWNNTVTPPTLVSAQARYDPERVRRIRKLFQ